MKGVGTWYFLNSASISVPILFGMRRWPHSEALLLISTLQHMVDMGRVSWSWLSIYIWKSILPV
jgi:hypothetical protein